MGLLSITELDWEYCTGLGKTWTVADLGQGHIIDGKLLLAPLIFLILFGCKKE